MFVIGLIAGVFASPRRKGDQFVRRIQAVEAEIGEAQKTILDTSACNKSIEEILSENDLIKIRNLPKGMLCLHTYGLYDAQLIIVIGSLVLTLPALVCFWLGLRLVGVPVIVSLDLSHT